MDIRQSGLNPSSLLDLKAELNKKYESFKKAKLAQTSESPKHTRFKSKNEPSVKDNRKIPVIKPKEDNEEELALQKSRLALEAKAKLYEKITSSATLIDDEENEQYLVDFQRKVLYNPPESEKHEKNETFTVNSMETNSFVSSELNPSINQSKEMQAMCRNSNSTEEKNSDEPVHYQNVQYNEVRDHGTAYFSFSTDETKRKEQMEELNALRVETEEKRMMKQKMLRKRNEMLQSRLAKVCERRNIDKNVVEAYTSAPNDSDIVEDVLPSHPVDLASIPLPEELEAIPKKEPKIRPWDVGKTDLPPPDSRKRKIMSQNDWIKEKRDLRHSEFAPPSFY